MKSGVEFSCHHHVSTQKLSNFWAEYVASGTVPGIHEALALIPNTAKKKKKK
jgi:hypothetical protein